MNIRLVWLIVLTFISLHLSAQSSEMREELEKRVEETNKVLPVSAMCGLVFQKKYIFESSVYEVHEVDEMYISLMSLKNKRGQMKKTLLKKYAEDPTLMSFAYMVVECNMDIVIQYVSKQTGDSFQMVLKTKELAKSIK